MYLSQYGYWVFVIGFTSNLFILNYIKNLPKNQSGRFLHRGARAIREQFPILVFLCYFVDFSVSKFFLCDYPGAIILDIVLFTTFLLIVLLVGIISAESLGCM